MLPTTRLLALAAAVSSASAAYQGFNYGSTFTDNTPRQQSDFEALFKNAQGLAGTNGAFASARLYTMIQAGTQNSPISAIPAAISTKTSLLLGLWASGGDAGFANELAALQATIQQYGSQLSGLIAGISVGSEDLYRDSPIGIANHEYAGASPDTLTGYVKQVRAAIAGTPLSGAPIGHVDTWTAYVNGSNAGFISALDWVGVDAYPYFQNTQANSIDQGASLFAAAFSATQGAAQGKPVWVTETGWPTSGKTSGAAVPSLENAKTYWDQVGCPMFGKTNVWWYTMQDASPTTPNPSFGLIGSTLTTTPLFDLSCANVAAPTTSSVVLVTPTSTVVGSGSGTSASAAASSSPANIGSPGANGQGGSGGSGTGSSSVSSAAGSSPTGGSGNGTGPTTTMATRTGSPTGSTGGSTTSAPPTVSGNAAATAGVPVLAAAAALLAFAL